MASNSTANPVAHPATPTMQLDQDEKRVLAECERESLIYRSIPLGLIALFATQYGMQMNKISSNGRWLKLGASLFTGYLIGKVSYAPTCRKKILTQIPQSNLAHAISGAAIVPGVSDSQTDHQDLTNFAYKQRSRDPNEAVVFLPDPVDPDTHTVPVGVNQYGDPIYASSK